MNIDIDQATQIIIRLTHKLYKYDAASSPFQSTSIQLADYVFHHEDGNPQLRLDALVQCEAKIADMSFPHAQHLIAEAQEYVKIHLRNEQSVRQMIINVANDKNFMNDFDKKQDVKQNGPKKRIKK